MEILSKFIKTLIQDNGFPGRDLNPETPESEARALPTVFLQSQCSLPKAASSHCKFSLVIVRGRPNGLKRRHCTGTYKRLKASSLYGDVQTA
jgi:hypothetical protein